ncbi:MAG: precorrin-2 dehydrogenase/sirohydrochlorin ferrochelatase family protein [Thermoanaerobacteraceae bacterium]
MAYYPVMVNLNGKRCLVVGGGKVAYRKVIHLLEAGAFVTVISPSFTEEILTIAESEKKMLTLIKREYEGKDVKGFFLVFACTDDIKTNKLIAKECEKYGLLVNIVDDSDASSFIVPAVLKRSDLLISISTGGKSPLLSRKIKEKLESIFDKRYEKLLEDLYKVREEVKVSNLGEEEKIKIYEDIIEKSHLF